jgi:hypothetical protein
LVICEKDDVGRIDSEFTIRGTGRLVASDGDAGANPEDRMQECLAGAARVQ